MENEKTPLYVAFSTQKGGVDVYKRQELQVFHFDRLPGFKGGFLFRADFHVTDCIGAFRCV